VTGNVDIDGGAIDGTNIGATTAGTGRFTTLNVTGNINNTTPAELEWLSNTTYSGAHYGNLSPAGRVYVDSGTSGTRTIISSGRSSSNVANNMFYISLWNYYGITATNGISPSSDNRLKHNEVHIVNGLEIIRQLKPQSYQKTHIMLDENYNGDLSGLDWYYEAGLIAQDILNINGLSYCVKDIVKDDSGNDTEEPYYLNYNDIFVYGLAATKELDNIVKNQENEIELLKQENELIKSKLNELLISANKETI
jgi:hypothetical protein